MDSFFKNNILKKIIFKILELKEYLGNYGRFGHISMK